jgi:hypothetical protein
METLEDAKMRLFMTLFDTKSGAPNGGSPKERDQDGGAMRAS